MVIVENSFTSTYLEIHGYKGMCTLMGDFQVSKFTMGITNVNTARLSPQSEDSTSHMTLPLDCLGVLESLVIYSTDTKKMLQPDPRYLFRELKKKLTFQEHPSAS
jgi:hypothetical protein